MTKCFTYLRNLGKIFLTNLRNLNKIFYRFVKSWQNIFTNLRNLDKIFFTNLRSFWRVAFDCYFHRLISDHLLSAARAADLRKEILSKHFHRFGEFPLIAIFTSWSPSISCCCSNGTLFNIIWWFEQRNLENCIFWTSFNILVERANFPPRL